MKGSQVCGFNLVTLRNLTPIWVVHGKASEEERKPNWHMLQGCWTYVLNVMLITLISSIVISTLAAVTYVIFT